MLIQTFRSFFLIPYVGEFIICLYASWKCHIVVQCALQLWSFICSITGIRENRRENNRRQGLHFYVSLILKVKTETNRNGFENSLIAQKCYSNHKMEDFYTKSGGLLSSC